MTHSIFQARQDVRELLDRIGWDLFIDEGGWWHITNPRSGHDISCENELHAIPVLISAELEIVQNMNAVDLADRLESLGWKLYSVEILDNEGATRHTLGFHTEGFDGYQAVWSDWPVKVTVESKAPARTMLSLYEQAISITFAGML